MQRIRGDWPRLFLTLMAVLGMLVHAVVPATASVHATPTRVPGALLVPGATLCRTDDGSRHDRPVDEHPLPCDHCPLCATAVHLPLAVLPEAGGLPVPSAAEMLPERPGRVHAPPRAPPRVGHPVRAPPLT